MKRFSKLLTIFCAVSALATHKTAAGDPLTRIDRQKGEGIMTLDLSLK